MAAPGGGARWIEGVNVQLVDGQTVRDAQGREVDVVRGATVAFAGGFAHILVPGVTTVQVVAAQSVWRATYRAQRST